MEGVTSIIVYLFGTTKIWQSLFVTRRICFWIFPFLEHSFNRSVLWWTSITISFPGRFIHGMRVVFECPSFVRTQCSYLSSVRESPESLRAICPMTSDASPTIFITHWVFFIASEPFCFHCLLEKIKIWMWNMTIMFLRRGELCFWDFGTFIWNVTHLGIVFDPT